MANHATQVHRGWKAHTSLISLTLLASMAVALLAPTRLGAQLPPEIVGRVEGSDFRIEAQPGMPTPALDAANVLTSGSRLTVRSGQVRILLNGGGEIFICGAARLQLLKSQGALTIALDFGTVRVRVSDAGSVAVFTPLVTATPISIGGGDRDTTVGLEQNGQMCLRSLSGAVRIAQQLSGESLLVPQLGGLTLSGGQLSPVAAAAPGCPCEIENAKLSPSRPPLPHEAPPITSDSAARPPSQPQSAPIEERPRTVPGTNAIAMPPVIPKETGATDAVDAPPSVDAPLYKVLMPALIFNAANPTPPPDPSPDTMILVRSVRAREGVIFTGTVEPKGTREAPSVAQNATNAETPHQGFFAKIGGFFRRVFGGSSGPDCAGAGCK
jgi:hypothetical protein